jgi:sugar-specific transcriptional regulator TrmB/pimeloyl-ACP methyl ester carboxylesterase/DNA polymerase III delta prime subunit
LSQKIETTLEACRVSRKKIKEALKDFGLTEKEAEIYIFLAKHGVLTGGEISKQAKTHRPIVYRTLKSLQKKGVVESTLESPIRFSSVPFENVLEKNIRAKYEEATLLEKTKNSLLSDWKKVYGTRIVPDIGKFFVIEGNRKIYSKISQMIQQAKTRFSAILTVPELVRNEQFGVYDAIYNHPLKSQIKFHFLTELSHQNLKAVKLLKKKLKTEFDLKGRNYSSSFSLLPRMAIRDNEEVMFFISPKSDIFSTGQDEACICTNNESLVQALAGIFQDLWLDSIDIDERIQEIETGKFRAKPLLAHPVTAAKDYDEAFIEVKKYARRLPVLASQLERIEYSLPKLVGREKELLQLEELARKTLEGNGKAILISGEAGIGKTRLANELARYSESQNFKVFECSCLQEYPGPLRPIRKVLADLFNISKQDTTEIRQNKIGKLIEEYAPKYMQLISTVDDIITGFSAVSTTFTEERFENESNGLKSLFESEGELVALSRLLIVLSEKHPILLFLDDLHFADSSTLKLFQNLAKIIQESSLLLIGTYRQEALTNRTELANYPFIDFVQTLKRKEFCQNIELKRLDQDQSSVLIKNILGIDDSSLTKRIHKESSGNPFFILETLRFLINKKLLKKEGDKWKLAQGIMEVNIPPKIHDLISRRTNILKEEERDILDCASVVGEEFTSDIITKVTGLNRLRVLKKLNNIERKYQLIHSREGIYSFDHSKIRQVLYQEMVPELRKEYHSLIGEYLEKKFRKNLEEIISELAHHYYMSRNNQKAVPYLLQAGDRSRKEYALFETIRSYSQALELMADDEKSSKDRTETLEVLGSLYGLAAEHEKANKCYHMAIASTEDETVKDRLRKKIRRKRIVKNGRTKIAYYVYGEGEPTILMLSGLVTPEMFNPQVNYFSQKHKVVTVDLRGTGESDKPSCEYTVGRHTDDLRLVIEDLQDTDIIIVGFSMGGMIGIKYTANNPGKISKMVLWAVNPAPLTDQPDFNEKARKRAKKPPSWRVRKFWETIFSNPGTEHLVDWGLKSTQKTPPEIFVNTFKNWMNEDVRPLLGKINIPTLIIQGEKCLIPLEKAKYLNENISESKLLIIKRTENSIGVFPNIFEGSKHNKILERFITTSEILKN